MLNKPNNNNELLQTMINFGHDTRAAMNIEKRLTDVVTAVMERHNPNGRVMLFWKALIQVVNNKHDVIQRFVKEIFRN